MRAKFKYDLKLLKDCIAHWKRMIKSAQRLHRQGLTVQSHVMQWDIEEDWGGRYCALCLEYLPRPLCDGCPLLLVAKRCNVPGSPYQKVFFIGLDQDATWLQWARAAKRMLAALEKARDKTRRKLAKAPRK